MATTPRSRMPWEAGVALLVEAGTPKNQVPGISSLKGELGREAP
jgi:hypothetical protein